MRSNRASKTGIQLKMFRKQLTKQLPPSGIAPELNRIQLSAICRGGQSGKVIDLLAWRCLPLGHPSAASGTCAVVQIPSSKRQCGKQQASLKPALDYMSRNWPSVLQKWAQQILWKCLKKMLFQLIEPIFSLEAIILVKFCRNSPSSKLKHWNWIM